jgi:hypothetical protein
MTFGVRDLMLKVMPADEFSPGGMLMADCTMATTVPDPAPPKPDSPPPPPPCGEASAAQQYVDAEGGDVSWQALAHLRQQLHAALSAGA